MAAAAAAASGHTNGHSHSNLQANLWEAATIVASAATGPAAVAEPVSAPIPVPIAVATPVAQPSVPVPPMESAKPAPVGRPLPQDDATSYNIPAFIAAARGGISRAHWFIFGGTAVFLGGIWAVIWFAAGK
jgi:uncharacterized membrane protein